MFSIPGENVIKRNVLRDFLCCMKKTCKALFQEDGTIYGQSLKTEKDIESFDSLMPGTIVNFKGSVVSMDVCSDQPKKRASKQLQKPLILLCKYLAY